MKNVFSLCFNRHRIPHRLKVRSVWALIAGFAIIFLIFPMGVQAAHADEAGTRSQQPRMVVVTTSDSSTPPKTFRVVLFCNTLESRTNGLQGFRKLNKNEAALFVLDEPEQVTFWMGSVAYSIDIIFVGPNKKIIKVYRNRQPGSQDLYSSISKTKWVIETAAGSGIKAGDRIRIE